MNQLNSLDGADLNQPPAFTDVDLFALDGPLRDAIRRAGIDEAPLSDFGRQWGAAVTMEDARLANENGPKLRVVDGRGNRIDRVEFHPSYHALMARSAEAGLACSSFEGEGRETGAGAGTAVTARAARLYMATGVEAGHMCPITMTHAAIPALRASAEPALYAQLEPKLLVRDYDARPLPWFDKRAITVGMGMTERQGGTDVRANVTHAVMEGRHARINGHKWFMSAPMCDAFLVLAQSDGGLGCYFVPRHKPDGSINGLRFRRLKPKLGNLSNASSEVDFIDAYAEPVGASGQGVKTIIEMVNWTRLDCIVSSLGLMRMGLAEALNHVRHRSVFQRKLIDQPLMRIVLADLALEMEGMVALVFRLTAAFDKRATDEIEAAYARLMTPVIKYVVCKRAPAFLYETMECLGGNGYVEELPMARLYREAPLNAIWEGSGNVMALDMLRAAGRSGETARAVIGGLVDAARAIAPEAEPMGRALMEGLGAANAEARARDIAEGLGRLAALAALADAGSDDAETYAETRLSGRRADTFGAVQMGSSTVDRLIKRAYMT